MNGLKYNPKSEVNRGQMAVMTLNALNLNMKGSSLVLAEKLNLHVSYRN